MQGFRLCRRLIFLSTQVENKTLARVLGEVKENVEAGSTYADALKKHPRVFFRVVCKYGGGRRGRRYP